MTTKATIDRRAVAQERMVQPGCLYPIASIESILGWTRSSTRIHRRQGLQVLYVGRNAYVLGDDVIGYMKRAGLNQR